MILNRFEFHLMNNPIRAFIQRHWEARKMVDLGGTAAGHRVIEVGCGRGVGIEIIQDVLKARETAAFDLDERMVALAGNRLASQASSTMLWIGDVTNIPVKDRSFDSVIDFGIIHHVPDWPRALAEVARILKPGGRFYCEEIFAWGLTNPISRLLFKHPQKNRFTSNQFCEGLLAAGFGNIRSDIFFQLFGWFTADRIDAETGSRFQAI